MSPLFDGEPDGYEVEKPEIFERVIALIEGKMMSIVVRHAVSGIANITLKTGCSMTLPPWRRQSTCLPSAASM